MAAAARIFRLTVMSARPIGCLQITNVFTSNWNTRSRSFTSRTAPLWNSLPGACFPPSYNLDCFKRNVNSSGGIGNRDLLLTWADVFTSRPPSLPDDDRPARILCSSGFRVIYRLMKFLRRVIHNLHIWLNRRVGYKYIAYSALGSFYSVGIAVVSHWAATARD